MSKYLKKDIFQTASVTSQVLGAAMFSVLAFFAGSRNCVARPLLCYAAWVRANVWELCIGTFQPTLAYWIHTSDQVSVFKMTEPRASGRHSEASHSRGLSGINLYVCVKKDPGRFLAVMFFPPPTPDRQVRLGSRVGPVLSTGWGRAVPDTPPPPNGQGRSPKTCYVLPWALGAGPSDLACSVE